MTDEERVELQAYIESRSMPVPYSGCLIWLLGCDQDGYGKMKWRGRTQHVSRMSVRAYHGIEPGPFSVMHSCDVQSCVNPNHLGLGTTAENIRDAAAKGYMHRQIRRAGISREYRPVLDRTPAGKIAVTAEIVRRLLDYDPETGIFTWLDRPDDPGWSRKYAGRIAGSRQSEGYRQIRIFSQDFLAHHLVWLYVHGRMPYEGYEIDHRFGIRDDNRLSELREVTHGQNNQNTGLRVNNRSGVKGVSWDGKRNKYVAMITVGNKQRSLGRYANFEDAVAARRKAEAADHGDYAYALTEGTA